MTHLSVIIPTFNEEKCIYFTCLRFIPLHTSGSGLLYDKHRTIYYCLYPTSSVVRYREQEETEQRNKEGSVPSMAESITQPDKSYPHESVVTTETEQDGSEQQTKGIAAVTQPLVSSHVIWTPRFIVLFFLTLIVGLSLESLLTQGWLNGFYKAEWVLLAHTALIFACMILLVIRARSLWMRVGGIFGCIWAVFTGADFVASLLSVNAGSGTVVQLYAAMSSALLGTYICLSTNHVQFRRWDSWFFRLAHLLGGSAIAILYFHLGGGHPLKILANATATVELYLCIFIWWLRPSCWRCQPCPTFLFGIAPLILLLQPVIKATDLSTYFFFSQVELLCLLLGVMRVLQGEVRE